MYKLATFFQSRFSVSEPTVETSSFKDLSHPPSIANSLTANSKPQLGYNGYSSIERPTSASRLSKIWTRFGRRTPEDFSIHEDEIISDELSDSKFNESSVSSLGVANKPSRLHHPLRRHTINLLKSEEEDSVSGAYCTDQVALLSNTSTEFVQRPPSMVRSRHRNFLQRKSRPPLISTSSDSNIDWYYPSTPSPVEVEISVEVVTRPAVLPACPISEPGSTRDENSTQKDTKKINPFDLAFAENSTGEIKETLSTRRKNKSRASLPNISTDLATILPPPKIETLMTRPLTVNTSDGNTPDLGRMSKDNSMIARKSRQRKANSTMQAEALNNSMRKNSFASGTSSRDEDLDADGISNVPSSCSFIWSDVVPDSPVIPSAPPPSPWATNTHEIPDIKESPPVQHNPWASMSSTYPISSPTTVTPQFFGQHIQQYSTAKSASPSPLGMIRKGLSPLGMETALDSPSLDTVPAAPPCTPCTPFPE